MERGNKSSMPMFKRLKHANFETSLNATADPADEFLALPAEVTPEDTEILFT
jgi:hypothetical protein